METIRDLLSDISDFIEEHLKMIVTTLIIIFAFIWGITGTEFMLTVALVILVTTLTVTGAPKELSGSLVFASIFTLLQEDIQSIVSIWWTSDHRTAFFNVLDSLGLPKLTLLVFLVVFGLKFFASKIQLIHVTTVNTIPRATPEEKKK